MSATDTLREAVEAVLSNEEHAFSGGMRSYAKGSQTWQVYEDLRQALTASLAVPSGPVPPGYKLLPIEPTPLMLAELFRGYVTREAAYAAMLAVAPTPKVPA